MDTQVLVIGAGPVGLTLAHELRRRGVNCQIFDRAPVPAQRSRALVVHCRTLELLEQAGLRERIAEQAVPVRGMRFRRGSKPLGRIPYDLGPYPALSLPQTRTEASLRAAPSERGATVHWGSELTAIHTSPGSVAATIADQIVTAEYVVGCDGARSTVRRLEGIPFDGETLEERIWMADATMDWDLDPSYVWQLLHHDSVLSAIPMPDGQWRLATMGKPGAEVPGPDFFAKAASGHLGRDVPHVDVTWISEFTVNCRLASTYGRGRTLLAGDAAHIHSPMGGQGMNVGMQDAFELARKLATELRTTPTDLLASYETERRPVAAAVIRNNARITKMAMSHRPVPRYVRNHVLPNVLRLHAPSRRAGLQASGLAQAGS